MKSFIFIVFFFACMTVVDAFKGRISVPLSIHHRTPTCTKPASTVLDALSGAETVIDPSFNLAAGALVIGTISGGLEDVFKTKLQQRAVAFVFGGAALLFTIFGGFLAFQTTSLRFTFDDSAFSLTKSDGSKLDDNIVVGGENRWAYKDFVNWQFLPSKDFPVLVYFKEVQTPEDVRVEAPIVVDNLIGQAHFFPAISRVDQLETNFNRFNCKTVGDTTDVKFDKTKKLSL